MKEDNYYITGFSQLPNLKKYHVTQIIISSHNVHFMYSMNMNSITGSSELHLWVSLWHLHQGATKPGNSQHFWVTVEIWAFLGLKFGVTQKCTMHFKWQWDAKTLKCKSNKNSPQLQNIYCIQMVDSWSKRYGKEAFWTLIVWSILHGNIFFDMNHKNRFFSRHFWVTLDLQ